MPVPLCQHIHDSGSVCGSPAVKDQKLCFFHLRLNQRPERRSDGSVFFVLRDLTCVESIQIAVSNVLHALNDGLIDSRKANSLYRGLSLALSTLRLKLAEKKHNDKESNSTGRSISRIFSLMPDNFATNTVVNRECSTGIPACAEAQACGAGIPACAEAQACGAGIPVRHADTTTTAEGTAAAARPVETPERPPLSNTRVKALKRIIRQGPRHPLFHSSARQLDAHIARTANANL